MFQVTQESTLGKKLILVPMFLETVIGSRIFEMWWILSQTMYFVLM